MKTGYMKIQILFAITVLILSTRSQLGASNCEMVEYEDHIEVVCGSGDATSNTNQTGTLIESVRSGQANDYKSKRVSQKVVASENNAAPIPSMVINGIVVIGKENKDGRTSKRKQVNKVEITAQCNVFSDSDTGKIVVNLAGIDRDGIEVVEVSLPGVAKASSTNFVSGTADIDSQKYMDAQKWQVKSLTFNNIEYSVLSNADDRFPEFQVSVPLDKNGAGKKTKDKVAAVEIASDNVLKPSSSGTNSQFITLYAKNGNIKFNHGKHQSSYSCFDCHGADYGAIKGFSKAMGHKLCRGCHTTGSGPTKCGDCHKK